MSPIAIVQTPTYLSPEQQCFRGVKVAESLEVAWAVDEDRAPAGDKVGVVLGVSAVFLAGAVLEQLLHRHTRQSADNAVRSQGGRLRVSYTSEALRLLLVRVPMQDAVGG